MYELMNQKQKIADIDDTWNTINIKDPLPLGFGSADKWLEDRKAYKHNENLKKLMVELGCDKKEGFIQITHSASINDSFWVKRADEDITWKDVSFYSNAFNEVISKLAFEGLGLYHIELSSTSPELTTDGSFRKCWKKEQSGIYLYKQGFDIGFNAGLEPYCEVLSAELVTKLCPNAVSYELVKLHGQIASKCKLFTDEQQGYVPLKRIMEKDTALTDILSYYSKLGAEEDFRRMLVTDAVTFNTDRHLGNLGILVDNLSQKPIAMAPNFDYNLSLLPYVIPEEFADIGTKLLDYGPKIGMDFTQLGQEMLTDQIRNDLSDLVGFTFTFRGDSTFPKERVVFLETLVNRQIEAILSHDRLQTREVFIPSQRAVTVPIFDNTEELKKAERFLQRISNPDITAKYTEELEDGHINCRIITNADENYYDIVIAMKDDEIGIEENGIEIGYEELKNNIIRAFCNDIYRQYDAFLDPAAELDHAEEEIDLGD